MSTHDYVIDNQTTPAFRSDLNNALAAIASNNSSATAPSTTYANMWWMDTTNNYLKIRDKNDANWIIVAEMDVTNSRVKLISDSIKAASAGGIDVLNSSGTKIIDLQVASQATAEAGTNNTELMTPLRTSQAIDAANVYPVDIRTFTTGTTSYTIPSGAKAVFIKAGGAGGGGASKTGIINAGVSGSDGGDTTVTNGTLSIAITAKGGAGGSASSDHAGAVIDNTSSGGDVVDGAGGAGGIGASHWEPDDDFYIGGGGSAGSLVTKYVTGSVGGQTLTLSIGDGGAGGTGTQQGAKGGEGWVEVWVW
jgi:hypothetical protein